MQAIYPVYGSHSSGHYHAHGMTKERKEQPLSVYIQLGIHCCRECGCELAPHSMITLAEDHEVLCLRCSGLGHLFFLPAGDPALTLRAKKYSQQWAVVLRWSRGRKRYERQGVLVEEAAVAQADQACQADEQARAKRRARRVEKQVIKEEHYLQQFTLAIREHYPHCPPGQETAIAQHACSKYSGRVGRAAFAKQLKPKAVELAVLAHIRHTETEYDALLLQGCSRRQARERVWEQVRRISVLWQKGEEGLPDDRAS